MGNIYRVKRVLGRPPRQRVCHLQYDYGEFVPSLSLLAHCNNRNGPICSPEFLTLDRAKVTCGRCRRIVFETHVARGYSSAQIDNWWTHGAVVVVSGSLVVWLRHGGAWQRADAAVAK